MSEHQPRGQHARLLASSEWSAVPAPGTRVLLTGAAGGLGRALSAALAEVDAQVVGPSVSATEPPSARTRSWNAPSRTARHCPPARSASYD